MTGIAGRGRHAVWSAVLDSDDPKGLARFYAGLLGWELPEQLDDTWVSLRPPQGQAGYLSFQFEENYRPPVWPAEGPDDAPVQFHLDIAVTDVAAAVADAEKLGARLADYQPQDDVRVMLDPAGHPFCLWVDDQSG